METSVSNHCRLDNGDANPHPVSDLGSPDARLSSHATKAAVNDSSVKINSDSSVKDSSHKSDDKSKSHKHHHHHRDDKKDRHHDKSKDRSKDKHREHDKNHEKSKDKDRHKDKEKSRDDKSKSDRPKDKHSSSKDDKHRSEKHDALKNVLNSPSSKPKDHHSSPSSQKLKENSHLNSSKDSSKHKDGLSSPKPKDEARLKEKLNNHHSSSSSSSHKTKVPNSTSGSSSHTHSSSKDKPKDSSRSEKSESKHRSKDGSSSHKDGSSSHKPKVADGEEKKVHKSEEDKKSHRKDKESHKSDKDKEKRKEHDKHKDEKRKEEKKHKEKENRDKSKENISKDKVHEPKSEPKPIKVKEEIDDERPPTPDIKRDPIESPIKLKVEKSWECFDGVKQEPSSDDDDVPLAARAATLPPVKKEPKQESKKRPAESDSEDEPLSARIQKVKKLKVATPANRKRKMDDSDDEPAFKKKKKTVQNRKVQQTTPQSSPTKKRTKKEEENQNVWKWWEEEKLDEGVKWKFLEHKGPVFAPDYEPLPKSVKFFYDGKEFQLAQPAEEVATFYARMLDHDYTTKEVFNKNFFKDWRKVMTKEEKELIVDLSKCNFTKMAAYFVTKTEERKAMTKEQKLELKKQNEEMMKEYGFCTIDGHTEKIGNFKIEPPGLFRGRGDHPKMGMLKKRTMPENVIINCSRDSNIPKPPQGQKWKEVRHDNTVTWLACWTESIQGSTKYVMLNASSKLKGEKDWQKYETARRLKKLVGKIRDQYQADWKSKEMRVRQRAVALYFIDKLALRAGNEKEEGETADTVGCCSLRVEHIKLHESGDKYMVDFDFLGKDSIRYQNSVKVEKRVYKNLQLFMDNKQPEDDLFDRLNTTILNKHLNELMDGLTAKVFRTYNASKTLQEQLDKLTNPDDPIAAKLLSYNRANRAVAILCNHQRAVPKTFSKSMENLQGKINDKKAQVDQTEGELRDLKRNKHRTGEAIDKKKKALERLKEQLHKLEVQATDKEENKDIALGTSKLNYLDPRISVAWCKKFDVPIEKVYNKTQRDKFRWAIDMAGPEYEF